MVDSASLVLFAHGELTLILTLTLTLTLTPILTLTLTLTQALATTIIVPSSLRPASQSCGSTIAPDTIAMA